MSYLFRGKKKYFDFIESLEVEEQEFRKLSQEYAEKSEMCNNDYKIQANHVKYTLRRLGAREIRHVNPSSYKTKSRATTSMNKSRTINYKNASQNHPSASNSKNESFLNTSPARIVSKQWPVRPNSAYRILAPITKIKKYDEMNEDAYKKTKDPPLIHSTGIPNYSFSMSVKSIDNNNSDQIFNNTQSPKVNEYGSPDVLNEVSDDDI